MVSYPIIGTLFAIAATVASTRGVKRNRDENLAIRVLSIATIVQAADVAAIAWSVLIGFYGIARAGSALVCIVHHKSH